jgi:hypothetical protein
MSLKKGFLKGNRAYKSNYRQHNQRLVGLIIIMALVMIALLYFGYVKL